ncbi:MAG: Maf family protein [Candidatus Cyclobacteriaceae bacterium M2_1C_046]
MNFNRPLTLASKSPRRQYLLKEAGYKFDSISLDIDESFDPAMDVYRVAEHLAERKAAAYKFKDDEEVVITADTVVIFEKQILGKPEDFAEAKQILQKLSGHTHEVVTGVCIKSKNQKEIFSDLTKVYFKGLSVEEIEYYIKNFKPYDKAGSYGAQDWWGIVGIEKLEGSYFNVMGLPTHKVYEALKSFK